jgi:O-antigen/teichoic acid export membrane protein
MISSVGMLILYTLVLKKQLPDYRFSLHYDKEFLPILSKFSGYMFISKISNIFSQYVVRFVVGFFLGPSAVTYYVLPAKLLNAVGGVLSGAFGVLFPFASELAANQDPVRIRRIYVDSSRLFAALAIPLLLFLALFSHQILEVWLGTDLADKGSTLLTLLALSGLVGSLTTVPNMIVMGLGHSKVIGLFSVLTVVVYIVSLPILTRNVGLTGTGYAMILATIPGIVLVGFQLKKILLIDIRSYLRQVFGFHVFPAVIVIVVIVLCDLRTYPTILVLGVGTVFLILYFVLMVATKWVKLK